MIILNLSKKAQFSKILNARPWIVTLEGPMLVLNKCIGVYNMTGKTGFFRLNQSTIFKIEDITNVIENRIAVI